MEMKEKIVNLIKEAGNRFSVVGETNDEKIESYEKKLNIRFPESYRWFLRNYGAGGIGSVDILGIDPDEYSDILSTIDDYKIDCKRDKIIPIYDCDEFIYCLDVGKNNSSDSEIVRLDISSRDIVSINKNFLEFLFDEFQRVFNL